MTDQRVTINAQGQPVYTSGIGRLPSAEYGVNSGLSGKVNTNVGGAILNSNANLGTGVVTTVPYGAAGNSGAYMVPNLGTVGRGTQEIRQTVTSTGPNYAYQQKYKQSRGPNSGTYERKIVETKPAYTNNPQPATPPPNYGTTSAYVRPVSNSVAAPMIGTTVAAASTPVITRNTYDHQPPVNAQSAPSDSYRCPKPLLALLGLLALAGIILGLLFGLGAIGGKNMVNSPTSSNTNKTATTIKPVVITPAINESPTLPNTISVETSVINSTKPTGTVSSDAMNSAAVTAPQSTSTTTVTTTTKTEGSTISTVIPSTSVSSTSTSTTPTTSVTKPNLTFDSNKAQTINYSQSRSTSTTPTTTVTKTTSNPTTTVNSSQTSTNFSIPTIQPISVAPIRVQPVTA